MESSAVNDTSHFEKFSCKKRRTLRDSEDELKASLTSARELKHKLIQTARENAKLKVLLMKYMDSDELLFSSSQLSTSNETPASSQTAVDLFVEESTHDNTTSDASKPPNESSRSQSIGNVHECIDFGREQSIQQSHWSDITNTSHLEDIISFFEKQDLEDPIRFSQESTLRPLSGCVRVGVGVLLTSPQHPECVLVGKRLGSHGEGKLALPGGHLEMYESWEECAIREVKEETDVTLERAAFLFVTNDPMEAEGRHYITIFMHASIDCDSQTIRNMEPHKCEKWIWELWSNLEESENLFMPLYHLIRDSAFQKRARKQLLMPNRHATN
uniref:Uncharacterized protein AlNc14C308G10470 n=1 Tax=Albugo laibachii Nc14 TaxID=890382 RepID=F0WW20_9STRA|nr:conserved hypothetical protein [Albugo laibachii Nc14]|eukprot:CCA25623.1 conserved hypothetical protein [Albugo laibachii Nc14]